MQELEKKIGAGQIEEVIAEPENEPRLSRNILKRKSWEPLETQAPSNKLYINKKGATTFSITINKSR